jgi:RNA polymerase sigma factor (TIGR02999 family)
MESDLHHRKLRTVYPFSLMTERKHGDVTHLLELWGKGDQQARDAMADMVHHELRRIADGYLRRERSGHTLQPTALVNEVWLRLVKQQEPSFENRTRFYALAAQIKRQILVDHARAAKTAKRGGGATPAKLTEVISYEAENVENFLILDDALNKLAAVKPRMAQIIELRYFAGLGIVDTAAILATSPTTVGREQKLAESMLSEILSDAAR